jgi:hypothetical protein
LFVIPQKIFPPLAELGAHGNGISLFYQALFSIVMNLTLLIVIFFDSSVPNNRHLRKGFIFHLAAAFFLVCQQY